MARTALERIKRLRTPTDERRCREIVELRERLSVLAALRKITAAIELCCGFCAIRSRPIKIVVVVTCEDGLSHEWEEDL